MKYLTAKKSKTCKTQQRWSYAALIACPALLLAVPATSYANGDQEVAVSTEKDRDSTIQVVTVTGSNIRQAQNSVSSSPITEVGENLIKGTASISIGDVLNSIPSITSGISSSSNNTSVGGDAANVGVATTSLRNLGSARTLVLVNGRRYVSGVSANTGYGVDLNSIPTSLIQRVDVLTGGQSAIYGSDAVAGVINIITKKNFSGFEFNAFGAGAEAGGAGRKNVDMTFGRNFESGNAWISAGQSRENALRSSERAFAAYEQAYIDADKDGIRESIARRNGPAHVPGAALIAPNGLSIFGNGAKFNTNQPLLDSNYTPQGAADWDNQNARRFLVAPYQRNYVASGLNFDLSPTSRIDVELNYSGTSSSVALEPAPVSVVSDVFRVATGGKTGINVATSPYFVGSSAGAQLVNALGADTSLDRVQTFKRLTEFGDRTVANKRNTFRIATGLTNDLSSGMSLKSTAVYGVTLQTQTNTGDFSIPNFRNAVTIVPDGKGGYQCADAVARIEGCKPVNPFGTSDSLAGKAGITGFSPEAIKYLTIATGQTAEIKQTVLNSVLSGALPFSISDKQPINFAAGVEYRKEQAQETPDAYRQQGLSRDLQVSAISGQFDVKEAFAEIDVPVARWLSVDLAARLGSYSTIGTAPTYRLGINAPVMDSLRFRGSWSKSVRAPNINDLFSNGTTSTAGSNTDVCNGVTASTAGNVAQNCRSIPAVARRIASLGSYTLVGSEANNTRLLQAGSSSLREETANSVTLGAVFTPVRGLSFSADYFDISIKNGITRDTADVYVRRCYGAAATSFDPTCGGNLVRDINDGPILNLRSPLINAANITTRGVDLELDYSRPNFNFAAYANYLNRYDVTNSTGAVEKFVDRPLFPKWRLSFNGTYKVTKQFEVFSQVRYRSSTKAFLEANNLSEDLNKLNSATYVDLRFNYRITDNLDAYVGVNNLADAQPDINPRDAATGTNTEPRAYDVIGRQYFVGLRAKFK
ncbi:TonB-dependent receptor domain-containing protein [Massilia sp. DWR3-1-1]|uniref:TonB-dependent receptor domain-containing protein n=1 Tax=Massilia sp. DWR3-1-1 TaxID=2804559 RepID=UPI003CF01ADD